MRRTTNHRVSVALQRVKDVIANERRVGAEDDRLQQVGDHLGVHATCRQNRSGVCKKSTCNVIPLLHLSAVVATKTGISKGL